MSGRGAALIGVGGTLFLGAIGAAILLMRGGDDGKDEGWGPSGDRRPSGEVVEGRLPSTDRPSELHGSVQGPDQQPLEGAEVTPFTFDSAPLRGRTVRTDSEGRFRIRDLPTGTYALRAEKRGVGSATRTGITLPPDTVRVLDGPLLLQAGVKRVAVCRSICLAEDVAAATKKFKQILSKRD